jgi:aminotransferase
MNIECQRVGGINLSQGVCDLEVPEVVRRGAKEAIDMGLNSYTRFDGLNELREAVAQKYRRFGGMEVDPASEVIISCGATGALLCACLALLDPNDEVIMFEPYYGYHLSTLLAAQAAPVFIRIDPPLASIDEATLFRAVTPRTKAILINTPSNPAGKVFLREELEIIAEVARRNDLLVITDEIYEHFVYDGLEHISIASLPGMKERTVTVSGLSKTFCITGWRVGYAICKSSWATAIGHFNDMIYICAPSPLQAGVIAGLMSLHEDYYSEISIQYQRKRDMLLYALHEAGLSPLTPQGAYYILADISRLPGSDSKERAMELLERTKIAAVPGESFYHDGYGKHLARFCFAKRDDELQEACRRLRSL